MNISAVRRKPDVEAGVRHAQRGPHYRTPQTSGLKSRRKAELEGLNQSELEDLILREFENNDLLTSESMDLILREFDNKEVITAEKMQATSSQLQVKDSRGSSGNWQSPIYTALEEEILMFSNSLEQATPKSNRREKDTPRHEKDTPNYDDFEQSLLDEIEKEFMRL